MLGVLRFWLDRGVDGFRVDALRQVHKDPELRDNPPNPEFRAGLPEYDSLLPVRSADHDDLAPAAAIAEVIAERDGVMIGELYLPFERLVRYYGAGVHMPSNMHLISAPWEPRALADLVERYEAALPDGRVAELGARQPRPQPRSRPASGPRRRAWRPMLLLHAARDADALLRRRAGDARRADPARARAGSLRAQLARPGRRPRPGAHADAVERRPQRRLLPAGGEPWLPLGDVAAINVEAERADPRSMLNLYRRLLALRRESRRAHERRLPHRLGRRRDASPTVAATRCVALNLSDEPRPVPLGARAGVGLSSHLDDREDDVAGELRLRPAEAVVVALSAGSRPG